MLLQHANGDAAFIREVLAGVNAYRNAPRLPRPPEVPEVARVGRARLLAYGRGGRPVLFVPSLINAPHVLDLAQDNSLLRWLAAQGFNPLLVDWGDPRSGNADLSLGGHVESLLLPLISAIGESPPMVGYCLGGTLTLAAAQLRRPPGVALIAAPWDFGGYPSEARENMRRLWEDSAPAAEALGLFPMELLQNVFWQLDPQRTLSKYADFGRLDPASAKAAGFVALEDWANDGPPLTLAAGRELLRDLHIGNMTAEGRWRVGGEIIAPAAIDCPVLNVISTVDRIVPAASAPPLGERYVVDQGHVGMMVGSRARAGLWSRLADWLSQMHHS